MTPDIFLGVMGITRVTSGEQFVVDSREMPHGAKAMQVEINVIWLLD